MTALTAWGTAAKLGEVVAHYDQHGRLTSAHTVRDIDLDLPANPIRVTACHDPDYEIGDLAHAELDSDGRLRCVVVLDTDHLGDYDGNLYFSPDYIAYGRGLRSRTFTVERATITGLAITGTPAGLAAKASPLETMRGDLRAELDRYSMWPTSWRTKAPLLERAVEQRTRTRTPTQIIGPPSADQQEAAFRAYALQEYFRENPTEVPRPNPGGIEYSQHRGRVISVR